MKKLLVAAIAILAVLFAPLAYNEYSMIKKMDEIQKFVDSTPKPFKVFRPPTASVSTLTNYTDVQMAITNDGVVYYYGKSKYKPDLIEMNAVLIVQHSYNANSSDEGGFATEKDGQKYYYAPLGGLRSLAFSKNTTYENPTEITILFIGEKKPIDMTGEEPIYSKKMIALAESMR